MTYAQEISQLRAARDMSIDLHDVDKIELATELFNRVSDHRLHVKMETASKRIGRHAHALARINASAAFGAELAQISPIHQPIHTEDTSMKDVDAPLPFWLQDAIDKYGLTGELSFEVAMWRSRRRSKQGITGRGTITRSSGAPKQAAVRHTQSASECDGHNVGVKVRLWGCFQRRLSAWRRRLPAMPRIFGSPKRPAPSAWMGEGQPTRFRYKVPTPADREGQS